ncbi:NAD(P)/FAD-dependent oxidoreductase [Corallococcus sp. AB004]|uniref:NAD(P)/FAD-dependent oxidoreductase n=1 Tax=Corallococcus TaxID=83461 RepID=UPI000EA2DFA1|nr:NAD(P)/FAD-dependent oxidoreductase [Corallococcus sp. AB038B]NPC70916.1 NAD(P)/FAD-dependent oxidoreductase [Corallococcus exiguus]RKI46972.1 NAD(P)/FAD-dependent oxidoreductase [Corallococcus sp. AB004]NPD23653.1 NAD(P)/FAD-dependent oxidoreductase [Corallococcus exiguus]NRD46811.1 NAD(P)/FAD-dependent oxidoreductase [Corallococcus exiguus]RKH94458.1 NAD(P)/FAD-dependent oxidoreductase [Corallococcus sp. AB038B]
MKQHDVVVVGGGPAGLAVAITAARRGLDTVVLERASTPVDKACGEGLMPSGLAALERLGALAHLDRSDSSPFVGIRYVQEDGSTAEGKLPAPGGLGVRRLALSHALATRAREVGVDLREHTHVVSHVRTPDGVTLETPVGRVSARFLVAADGLNSPLRKAEDLDVEQDVPRRYGLRRHFRRVPWTPYVEVHFASGVEAYVTPAGAERVGIAFLWEDGTVPGRVGFDAMLERFPRLAEKLTGAEPDSQPRGAGPLARVARTRIADRFALVGDAAGYVDALTGEGLTLAFACAESLGALLPDALAKGAGRDTLLPYEHTFQQVFRKYAWTTHGLLMLARRPRLRRPVVRLLGRAPWLFERILAAVVT